MPPTSLSSLPTEVIPSIANYLNLHDLAQCVLVCDKWAVLFNPFFWRRVRAGSAFRGYNAWTALVYNIRHIRSLDLVDPLVAQILSFTLQEPGRGAGRLESLSARFDQEAPSLLRSEKEKEGLTALQLAQSRAFGNVQMLVLMMKANKNLKSLTVDESCFRRRDGTDAFSYIMENCPTAQLERLEVWFGRHPSLPSDDGDDDGDSGEHDVEELFHILFKAKASVDDGTHACFNNLKELVISGGGRHIDFSRLAFLARCPNLERIQVEHIDATSMLSLGFTLGYFCEKLSCLDWRGAPEKMGAQGDKSISDLLSALKVQWKELSLPNLGEGGPKSFAALMKHVGTTLEVLKVNGLGSVSEDEFLDLLCSAQHLRRLEGPRDGEMSVLMRDIVISAFEGSHMHLKDGKERSWALGPSMEFLQLRILNVPRPDVVCTRHGNPFKDIWAGEDIGLGSRYVHEWVYKQLGKLTSLQELVLGVMELDPKELRERGLEGFPADSLELEDALRGVFPTFGYYCLEFSLESGLKMLAGMKELRMLDVKATAHRIGVAELEWMHINWPKLKEIKGLVSAREWAGDVEGGLEVKAAVEECSVPKP
ncbi:hypothetical protein BGZ96_008261 [Linnemannia gamsii]|uniref:F-box domain-containing protein n=1 Tax=Linnemannia gamsii TaxID=64522 RepID=A0ABQ7JZS1_9FUNG|nr:hypothetical protein BGZ96_008261 [Linnemannia gamsii]